MARRAQAAPKNNGEGKTGGAPAPHEAHPKDHNGGDENLFFKHLKNIEALVRAKDVAVKDVRVARAQAKQDGIDLKALDSVRTLHKYSEPELARMFNNQVQYAKYLNLPVYSQIALFTTDAEKHTTNEDAYKLGIIAGKRGESAERNPWTLDTELGREWGRGHVEGNMELAGGFKETGRPPAPMFDDTATKPAEQQQQG